MSGLTRGNSQGIYQCQNGDLLHAFLPAPRTRNGLTERQRITIPFPIPIGMHGRKSSTSDRHRRLESMRSCISKVMIFISISSSPPGIPVEWAGPLLHPLHSGWRNNPPSVAILNPTTRDGAFVFAFSTEAGHPYIVQFSPTLNPADWSTFHEPHWRRIDRANHPFRLRQNSGYYRVGAQ